MRIDTAVVAHVAGRSGGTLPGKYLGINFPDHLDHLPSRLLMGCILGPILPVVAKTAGYTQGPIEVLHDGAEILWIIDLQDLEIGGRLAEGRAPSLTERPRST